MSAKDPDIKGEDLSILAWIFKNNIVSEKGEPLDFSDRLFLLDILTDWSKEIVIKKAAQIGGSVSFNLKALFAVIKFGWNILYTFPTDSDVQEFVSSKTNKILASNQQVFAGLPTDNIERKGIGDRFMFFKGTVSKTAAIMTTADLLIHDEASRSDQSVLEMMKSRVKASMFKGRWLFSNPTTEKDEIDRAWNKSDQKEWMVTCKSCQSEQTLVWPASIDLTKRIFQCKDCHKELSNNDRRIGRWVPQRPGKSISGYHISLLMAPWIDAEEIIRDSEGDQEYFYNFVLGEPYSPGDIRVSRSTILDNWTPKDLVTGTYYLGVDVGNVKHYVLGSEKGVTQIGTFSKWEELDELMVRYKPITVIDSNPDNTMARHYVEKYPNTYMSFFKENKDNPKTIVWWGKGSTENDKDGIVYSNRNRILDQMIFYILHAKMLFALPSDKGLKLYLKHWETLRRIKVTDNSGIETYEWDSTTGEDHYVFATLYFYLAILGQGSGVFMSDATKKKDQKKLISDDNVVQDIGEVIMDANNWND